MSLRGTRLMTSIFLTRGDQVLLLYRIGSSAIPDSWVGVGGHVEPDEIRDPTATVLREMYEEIGLTANDIDDLCLRYVAVRDDGREIRSTYYFTACLNPDVPEPTACTEGELRWFDLETVGAAELTMPPTAAVAFSHWIAEGRHDDLLRSIVITSGGPRVFSLAEAERAPAR